MPAKNQRTVTISDEIEAMVADYQQRQGLRSWNAALLELARIGYKAGVGGDLPSSGEWGGERAGAGKRKTPKE